MPVFLAATTSPSPAMTDSSAKPGLLSAFVGKSLWRYVWMVQKTSHWIPHLRDIEGRRQARRLTQHHPFIMAMWHGQFMLLPLLGSPKCPTQVMVARHGDAAIMSEMLKHFGMDLIRGAGAGGRRKDRGGAHAVRAAQEALRNNISVAMTADVPPGPARRAGMGIVTLARITGRPIVPVAIASSHYIALGTWSRLTINLPWSVCGSVVGEAVVVPPDADAEEQERCRQRVEESLNAATRQAYAAAGVGDPVLVARAREASGRSPMLAGYRGITRALEPLAPVVLAFRTWQGKEDRERRGERLGRASLARPPGSLVWMHAASVGEATAVSGLIGSIRARRPDLEILLTTGTVTSAQIVRERLAGQVLHQFVPIDVPGAVRRFLDHWKPKAALLVESEIWPNMVVESAARGIPLALVNARISQRSFRSWQRRPAMARALLGKMAIVLAQSEMLSRRFARLGARDVRIAGNLKFDSPALPLDAAEASRLEKAIAAREVWVAASTHEGEETIVAEAHRQLLRDRPQALLIIVPRHPDRGPAIATALRKMGLAVSLRSTGALPQTGDAIYVADTMGELGLFYSHAAVAFIGRSLVKHGGQNPIEAVKLGAGVLTGPNWSNFEEAYKELLRKQGAREVCSAPEIAAAVKELMADPQGLARLRRNAEGVAVGLGGALTRTLEALDTLLPPAEVDLARAS